MKFWKRSEKGFSLPFAVAVAAGGAILLLGLSKVLNMNTHQAVYLNGMREAFRLAESGLNSMVGQLVVNPGLSTSDTLWYTGNPTPISGQGEYQNYVIRRDAPIPNGYYIVTCATRTISGKKFAVRLHSYVAISNASEYLIAVTDAATITDGIDASSGKVYAPKLTFMTDKPAVQTKVKAAEYVETVTPNPVNPADIVITENSGQPLKLPYRITFPQVLDSDIDRYTTLAHATGTASGWVHEKCSFTGDVFPPGYYGGQDLLDSYPSSKHTDFNEDHVYYCHNDITFNGDVTVHGQVLFVTTNTIYIGGNLRKATGAIPGAGSSVNHISSSTAHEAVLITRKNVIVNTAFYPAPYTVALHLTQTIEAMVLAPHGTFKANTYPDPNGGFNEIHGDLKFRFKGSMVTGSNPNFATTFLDAFGGTPARTYEYDEDLLNFPPPYMPALADIRFSIEDTVDTPNAF